MSARETANLRWVGSCEPRALTVELNPAQWMVACFFVCQPRLRSCRNPRNFKRRPMAPHTSHYGAKGRWVPGPTAIQGG